MILLHLFILSFKCWLKSTLESKISRKCFWELVNCILLLLKVKSSSGTLSPLYACLVWSGLNSIFHCFTVSIFAHIVMYPEFFLGIPVHTSNPRGRDYGWLLAAKFSKCLPLNALNMNSAALSELRFPCKTFPKLLKFLLGNTTLHRWFLQISYIDLVFK